VTVGVDDDATVCCSLAGVLGWALTVSGAEGWIEVEVGGGGETVWPDASVEEVLWLAGEGVIWLDGDAVVAAGVLEASGAGVPEASGAAVL
jgi:hypothetical protein